MPMRNETSEAIDALLRGLTVGGLTLTMLLLPGTLVAFDKPLQRYFDKLDKEARERELRKMVGYMRRQNLIADNYEHGLHITDKARKRLAKADLDNLQIPTPEKWDKTWRIVFYDIPEKRRDARQILSNKLYLLGLHQLQRSVWIHPFPCEEIIQAIASAYGIDKYITYIEAKHINNQPALMKRFSKLSL
jgi:DNA-binding transcriptional regulator PaaX